MFPAIAYTVQMATAQPMVLSELNIGIGGLTGREQLVIDGFSIEGVVEGVAAIPTVLSVDTDEIAIDTTKSVMILAPIVIEILGMRINAAVEPFSYADNLTLVGPNGGKRFRLSGFNNCEQFIAFYSYCK